MLLIVCLPVVFWEETETALGLAAILLGGICRETMLTSLPQFSFPLDWCCDGHDFFFRGDKLVTGASAREVYDRAFSLVPRRCVRAGAWSDRLGSFLVTGTFLSELD